MNKIVAFLGVSALAAAHAIAQPSDRDIFYQVSSLEALLAGAYDGRCAVSNLLAQGNIGLGTFDALDGEMIVLDGHCYQALASGAIRDVSGSDLTTPFACVTEFTADLVCTSAVAQSLPALEAGLDARLPLRNSFYAIRVDGLFPSLKVRSVPRQTPPYPPLTEAVKRQSVFIHSNLNGTAVGLRCPDYMKGLNVPGYHWHFLSADGKKGGHVLDLTVAPARIEADEMHEVHLNMPGDRGFDRVPRGTDPSAAIKAVEH